MRLLLRLRHVLLLLLLMLRFVAFGRQVTQRRVPFKELRRLLLLEYVLNHLVRFLLQGFLFLRFTWGLSTLDFWEEEGISLLFQGRGHIILGGMVIRWFFGFGNIVVLSILLLF